MNISSEFSSQSVVVAVSDQVSSELSGEVVILSLKDGVYYGLNEVGALIWSTVQQPHSVREVCDAVLEVYDVSPEDCERDVLQILEELHGVGLIEAADATTS